MHVAAVLAILQRLILKLWRHIFEIKQLTSSIVIKHKPQLFSVLTQLFLQKFQIFTSILSASANIYLKNTLNSAKFSCCTRLGNH